MMNAPWLTGRQRLASQAGYSLQEIMMVTIIVGIMSGIAITSFRGLLPQSRLRAATTELQSALNLARIMAMSQNATMTLQISGGGSSTFGSDVTLTSPITATVIRTLAGADSQVSSTALAFPSDVTSLTVAPGFTSGSVKPWVRFNSMGLRAGTGNQLITLTNSQGKTYSIVVTPGGKSQWCLKSACP